MNQKLIVSILMIVTSLASQASDPKMSAKWHKLNKLIDQEIKTIHTITKRGPRLQWRLVELDTERIKLIKERENQIFLNSPHKQRKRLGKKHYFKKSRSQYLMVRKKGLSIIKRWPRFKYNSEIYYTLALNSRDYGGDKETEKFLLNSLRVAIANSPIIHSAKTSLAEHYYNGKKYGKAIRYYKDVLKNKNDEWYTKHLFNVSWCYLKVKKYNKAIEHAKESFKLSKTKNYINVKSQVLNSIGFFYILGERIKEGASFYIENVEAPGAYLIKMAKKTAEDKGQKLAHYVFEKALEHSIDTNNTNDEIKIRLSLLDFYRNFKMFDYYWRTTQALDVLNQKNLIAKEDKDDATTKIRSFVGYLQVRFTKNAKTSVTNYSEGQKERILNFFDILVRLNPIKTDNYRFYQGETLFAISKFSDAFKYYQKSLDYNKVIEKKALNKKKKELRKKIFNSLLASLENARLDKKQEYDSTVYTYTNHLELYPVDPRSQKIYSKLFNLYLKNEKIELSLANLDTYKINYPKDNKIQQGMFTQVLDYYIANKDSDKIAQWIPKLESGYLKFDKKYIERATVVLGTILFDSYQKLDSEGKKDEAAKGYLALYKSEKYPQSIKAKSAYRASILYLALNETQKVKEWLTISLKLFKNKESFKRRTEVYTIVHKLMVKQDFTNAAFLATSYLKKFCSADYKVKHDLMRASIQYNIIQGNNNQAIKNLKFISKCSAPLALRNELKKEMANFYYSQRSIRNYQYLLSKNYANPAFINTFKSQLVGLYWHFYHQGDSDKMKQVLKSYERYYPNDTLSQQGKEIAAIKHYSKIKKILKAIKVDHFMAQKAFNENLFNSQLEQNIESLKKITQGLKVSIQSGVAYIITDSYKLLGAKYTKLSQKLFNYIPKNMPKEYQQGFTQAMKSMAQNLANEANKQNLLAKNLIYKETILDYNNKEITGISPSYEQVKYRHPASLYVLPTDKMKSLGEQK